ncbi:MAG: Uma2 family endonuclease [Pirellulaceae bacterium]
MPLRWISGGRIPAEPIEGFFPGPPDLAGEIRSPHDKTHDILDKIALYLEFGVQVVWDVDPKARIVTVYRPDGGTELFREGDTLTEQSLLPGFSTKE